MEYKKSTYKYGFRHYWEYFKTNMIIANKRLFEYKVNMLNVLLIHIIQIFTYLVFGYTFVNIYGNVIGWDFRHVLIFILSVTITYQLFAHVFFARKVFRANIVSGKLNLMLIKPGNIILNYILKVEFSVAFFFLNIAIYIIMIFYMFHFNWFNFILSIPLMLFVATSHLAVFFFIESISFFLLEFGHKMLAFYRDEFSRDFFMFFPSQLFDNAPIKFILSCFPLYYISTLIVPLIAGDVIVDFQSKIIQLIIITIIFSLGVILNWHFGLKKYNAFG